ncbi:hypothetical protein FHW16_004745 [Phyllobacterium myrsinacearum]|uniref:Transposase IS110-like N-terminal domain-containing protein n=1 Tax=Phyllobacterium myrsinacearum TaxID=28101 RepID=A0A839EWZ0_9HYPH|nr:hypothetical protein [Phyllobacterium myrsinacearum]
MNHYVGLDVSVKETSLCIVDETGKICREVKVVSHPDDLIEILKDPAWHLVRIGLEAGPLSQWLFEGLASAGLPVVCIETRHTKAFLKATVNKTDRNDALWHCAHDAGQSVSTCTCQNDIEPAAASLTDSAQARIKQDQRYRKRYPGSPA